MLAGGVVALHAAHGPLGSAALHSPGGWIPTSTPQNIDAWSERRGETGGLGGVVFGDSVFAPLDRAKRFVNVLGDAFAADGLPIDLLDVTSPGFSAIQYYCVVDRILAGRPDFVVVEVNLRTFADDWLNDSLLRLPALSADLSPLQMWPVRRAMATQQLGILTPLVYRVHRGLGVLDLVAGARVLGTRALDAVGTRLNAAAGLHLNDDERFRSNLRNHVEMNGQHARAWYGREFTASPMAEVLRALNAELRAAGAVTVYVVAPTPRADLNELGVSLVELNARKERLRRMIGASRAQWIDTSGLYERNDFLDGFHVRPELVGRMTAPVVDRLRPILEAQGVPPVDERAAGVEAVADVVPPNGAVQAEARPGTDAVQTAAGMAP